jgi:hypothetical protein
LFDPPSRSTAWRVGFDTPKDYNVSYRNYNLVFVDRPM